MDSEIKATQKQDLRRFFVLFPLEQLFQQFTLKLGSDHTHRWIPGLADLEIDCMIVLRTTWTNWSSWGPLGPLKPLGPLDCPGDHLDTWTMVLIKYNPRPPVCSAGNVYSSAAWWEAHDGELVEGSVGYSWAGQLAFQAFHAALETCMAAQIVSGPAPYHTSTIPPPAYSAPHTLRTWHTRSVQQEKLKLWHSKHSLNLW